MTTSQVDINNPNTLFKNIASLPQWNLDAQSSRQGMLNQGQPVLRLALLYREQLSLPHWRAWTVRILAGNGWVSFNGMDFELKGGDSLCLPKTKHAAIISAVGGGMLFLEISGEPKSRFTN